MRDHTLSSGMPTPYTIQSSINDAALLDSAYRLVIWNEGQNWEVGITGSLKDG